MMIAGPRQLHTVIILVFSMQRVLVVLAIPTVTNGLGQSVTPPRKVLLRRVNAVLPLVLMTMIVPQPLHPTVKPLACSTRNVLVA